MTDALLFAVVVLVLGIAVWAGMGASIVHRDATRSVFHLGAHLAANCTRPPTSLDRHADMPSTSATKRLAIMAAPILLVVFCWHTGAWTTTNASSVYHSKLA
jgi:hypothetical protein